MAGLAREGDRIAHDGVVTGVILSGCETVHGDGLRVARQGDAVSCTRHGENSITGGSGTVFAQGKRAARRGDPVACGAEIVSGSGDILCG